MKPDQLVEAAEAGDGDAIERAIERGADLNARDRFGRTPLLEAAKNDRLALVRRLLVAGARPDAHAEDAEVKYALGSNARRELCGRWTLLHAAALGGADAVIAYLVDGCGFDANVRDHGGWTPLHVAACYPLASDSTLRVLLARGADPNEPDALGRNALCCARDAAFARLLLDAGARPGGGEFVAPVDERVPVVIGGRIVSYARADRPERPLEHFAAAPGSLEVVDLLLARGAPVTADAVRNATSVGGEVLERLLALRPADAMVAASLAYAPREAVALRLLAELEAVPADAPLTAVQSRWPGVLRALAARGVSPTAADAAGTTPLHVAAERGDPEIVRLLVELGADPNAADARGKTPRALAWTHSTPEYEAVRRYLEPLTAARPAALAALADALAVGARVQHAKFGPGTVLRLDGTKVVVRFDESGEKTLIATVLSPLA